MTGKVADQFLTLLKKKGIGPTMSKSLDSSDLCDLTALLGSDEISLARKAAFLSALLILEKNPEELAWIASIKSDKALVLPEALRPFFTHQIASACQGDSRQYLEIVLRLTQGLDLNQQDMTQGMSFLFRDDLAPYLKAAFLEGLRVKRETDLENQIAYQFLWGESRHFNVGTPILIDLANAYDGFNRSLCFLPFMAALLASIGFPTILHGVSDVGPKHGVNVAKVLKAAKKNEKMNTASVIRDLEDPNIGWAYLDQQFSFPQLHDLIPLRGEIVKRPLLSTFEKLLQPLRSLQSNYLVTSYTHPPYKNRMLTLLKDASRFKRVMLIRGLEGSIEMPFDRRIHVNVMSDSGVTDDYLRPEDYGVRPVAIALSDFDVDISLKKGLEALNGVHGYAREWLFYQVVAIVEQLKLMPLDQARAAVTESVAKGRAIHHWHRGAL